MSVTDSDSTSSSDARHSLDDAIEQCLLALEHGNLDIEELTSRYPQYESEIVEFLENWGGMESVAVVLAEKGEYDPLETVDFEPREFGDFELLKKIGVGGMGTIYKARQISLDRIVALKMIRGGRKDDGRFQMEAEAAASLSHPNIVSIHEVGNHSGRQFFSMQFVDGCNLSEYVEQHSITPNHAARVTGTIARAVHYAHQRGILHRDLKPANVLMDGADKPYVTDFGLAKHIERDTELTQSGTILGTPGYMAPEQASGKTRTLTTATDVYGLGALLYALLTGAAPFTGDSSLHVLRRVVDEPAASPRLKNANIDRDLETICLKCLEKSPESRYSSANALADDLARYLNGEPVRARPVTQLERAWRWCKRNRTVAILSGMVVALMVATTLFAAFLAYSERNSRLLSQENSQRESSLNKDLNVALERGNRERANLLMTNGLWQASNQNVGEALLWFSEASRMMTGDPDQVRNNLIRCQSWLSKHPMPIAATRLGQHYRDEKISDKISFQPNGSAVLYGSGRRIVIWDYQEDRQWHLTEAFPKLTCAIWSLDGSSIIVGLNDGRIVEVNVENRKSKTLFQVESAVLQVVYANQGRWLAFASGNQVYLGNLTTGEVAESKVTRPSPVRYLLTNSSGTRLVVINRNRNSSMFSIDGSEAKELFSFNCHFESILDHNYKFWPHFVKNDQALLVRIAEINVVALDPDTGELLGPIPLASPTCSLSIAPDGQSVVTGSFNFGQSHRLSALQVRKKSSSGNEPAKESTPRLSAKTDFRLRHDNLVVTTAIGPNGLVATAGMNNDVRIWKPELMLGYHEIFDVPEKAKPIFILPHHTQVRRVAFLPDGKHLISIQMDGLVRLWRIPDTETNGYEVKVEPGGSLVKLVDDNRWMASGMSRWSGHMANATVRKINDGTFASGLTGYSLRDVGHLLDSDVSPDGQQLATLHAGKRRDGKSFRQSGGRGGWLKFWRLEDGEPLHKPIPMPSEPRWITYHPHENCLAVCTCLMEIVIVDTTTFQIREVWQTWQNARATLNYKFIRPDNIINELIEFSPDGKYLAVRSSQQPGFMIWDYKTGKMQLPANMNEQWPIGGFAFSPDGGKIAIAGGRNTIAQVFDLDRQEFACKDLKHASVVHSVSFSPDGKYLLTGCRDGHARVFDWRSGQLLLKEMTHDADVVDASYTPDSRFIATLGHDNQLRIWNARDGSLALRPWTVPARSGQMVISPDSRFVIVGGSHIRVADLAELQSEPEITLARARQISEILASKTITDGSLVSLSAEDWLDKWQKFIDHPQAR